MCSYRKEEWEENRIMPANKTPKRRCGGSTVPHSHRQRVRRRNGIVVVALYSRLTYIPSMTISLWKGTEVGLPARSLVPYGNLSRLGRCRRVASTIAQRGTYTYFYQTPPVLGASPWRVISSLMLFYNTPHLSPPKGRDKDAVEEGFF